MGSISKIFRSFLLVLLPSVMMAQEIAKTENIKADSIVLSKAIFSLEQKHPGYTFYFNNNDTDSIYIKSNYAATKLTDILDHLVTEAGLYYAIDKENRVFINQHNKILTTLPVNFFEPESATSTTGEIDVFNYFGKGEKREDLIDEATKLHRIGKNPEANQSKTANLAGIISDIDSKESVIGAVVYIESPQIGVGTDAYGYYSITLPKGRHEILIKSIGMKDTKRQVLLNEDGNLDISMEEDILPLKEVIIESEKDRNISQNQMGMDKLEISTLKQIPPTLGEVDVLKVALTLPGVQSVGESSTGLNVRGGNTDQNLILFNDATIFNPSHLFGFFSSFNPDVLKGVELYKSGIPSNFGGRLSSVLEVTTREGNKKKFIGSGGISPVSGRLALEGPIIKEKLSVLIAGRSTYSDWILKKVPSATFNNSTGSFYDFNAHLSYDINEKNSVYASWYSSHDEFKLNSDTLYQYNNKNTSIKWKHVFKNTLYGVFRAGMSEYDYNISSKNNVTNAFDMDFNIRQTDFKADFNFFPNSKNNIDFGLSSILYQIAPGNLQPKGEESLIIPKNIQDEAGVESALYIGNNYEVSDRISIYGGLRYSLFNSIGPQQSNVYKEGVPRSENSIIDTLYYESDDILATYHGPELRFSAKYSLLNESSIKISYNRMRQYVNMISNTTAISPLATWKLSDQYVKPQIGDQFSIGYYKNLRANTLETSVEVYYKSMKDVMEYKNGALLILNPHVETDLVSAKGRAYGAEFMLKKPSGKLNGWVSYTYSRSLVQIDPEDTEEPINQGEFFSSNFDKPHDFTFIGNYKFSRRVGFSLNFTYSTGRPITFPLTKYNLEGASRLHYSSRNEYRVPDYIRTDISLNIEGNHKVKKLAHNSWTIAVYNLLARKNVYSIYFLSENGAVNGYKLSIFGQAIPTITYNFKF